MTIHVMAESNFNQRIKGNLYSGRGLVIGKATNASDWLILYWIMGRSENSRNRRIIQDRNILRTAPVDIDKITDPSLTIYEVMLDLPGLFIVGNGDQTHTVYETIQMGGSFESALALREREPDEPNYTPRITGMLNLTQRNLTISLSILKANPLSNAKTDHYYFYPANPEAGYGYGITTYRSDGDPPPSFCGDPMVLPLIGEPEEIMEKYWENLNPENRVAIAIKCISHDGRDVDVWIKNRL